MCESTTPESLKEDNKGNIDLALAKAINTVVMFATVARHHDETGHGIKTLALNSIAGAIKVDKYSRTNIPSIYAVGGVTNRINLTR